MLAGAEHWGNEAKLHLRLQNKNTALPGYIKIWELVREGKGEREAESEASP